MKRRHLWWLLLIAPLVLSATTIQVHLEDELQFSTIQNAINYAAEGDTIFVGPGVYHENLDFNGRSNLTLMSVAGEDITVIDGSYDASPCIRMTSGESNITISGFSIRGARDGNEAYFRGSGMHLDETSNITLENLMIYDNVGGGLLIYDSQDVFLSNLTIKNNIGSYGGGITLGDNTDLVFDPINRCSIYDNYSQFGMDIFSRDDFDIYLDKYTFPYSDRSTYYYYENGGWQSSYTTPSGVFDVLQPVHQFINSDAYVSPTGSDDNDGLTPGTPLKTPWIACLRAKPSDNDTLTIHLSEGTHFNQAFGKDVGILVRDHTILQGVDKQETRIELSCLPKDINAIHLEEHAEYTSIRDFTLSNFTNCSLHGYWLSNIDVTNVSFENSAYSGRDDLIEILGEDTVVSFERVDFINNFNNRDITKLVDIKAENVTLTNCCFQNNSFEHTSQRYNSIGLLNVKASEFASVVNCSFIGNRTDHPYYLHFDGINTDDNLHILIDNCIFIDNNTSRIVRTEANHTYIYNCTFYNSGNMKPHLITSWFNYPITLKNCLFDEVFPMTIIGVIDSLTFVDYCAHPRDEWRLGVEPSQMGSHVWHNADIRTTDGEMDSIESCFYDETNSIHLSDPIDNGTMDPNDFYPGYSLPEFDILGNPRVYNNSIDIGAIEYYPPTSTHEIVNSSTISLTNYPNPFNPTTTIAFNLPENDKVELSIYNIKGQKINTLVNDIMQSGNHTIVWNGEDSNGKLVGSGFYFYQIKTGNVTECKRMLLMK